MATKGKDKIIDGQIAFDFLGEIEVVKPQKKVKRVIKEKKEPAKQVRVIKYKKPKIKIKKQKLKKKKYKCIKPNHLKKSRKTRRLPRKFKRS